MKTTGAVGILTAIAILLIWAGFSGRVGLVLAALVAPQALASS